MALSSLRQLLEPADVDAGSVVRADRFTVQLNPAAIRTDVAEFEATLRVSDKLEAARHAVELYQGALLTGYYEEWIGPEQQRLAEQFFSALQHLLAHLTQRDRHDEAMDYARRAVAADPVREDLHVTLIRLLAARGRSSDAFRQYREMERLLDQRLGEAPSFSAQALLAELKQRAAEANIGEMAVSSLPLLHPALPPTGTVTLLFAEIEGDGLSAEKERQALRQPFYGYRARVKQQIQRHGGQVVREENKGLAAVFSGTAVALACALRAQQALQEDKRNGKSETGGEEEKLLLPVCLRIALHTGEIGSNAEPENSPAWDHTRRLLAAGYGGQILCSEMTASLVRLEMGAGVRLMDLGLYRLLGEETPEHLFQVLGPELPAREFPPLKAAPGYNSYLPVALTRFFGREDEIARLKTMLAQRSIEGVEYGKQAPSDPFPPRLVTLTGPGGSGKTRLALAVAEQILETFSGAVWFVPLADVTDASRIGSSIADSLRLPRLPMVEPLEQVAEFLNGLRIQEPASESQTSVSQTPPRTSCLLVLDNFEHLVDDGAAILQALLERVTSCTCLVTSRRRLAIQSEQEFHVAPLPVPNESMGLGGYESSGEESIMHTRQQIQRPAQLMQYPSIGLFIDRAQSTRVDFQLTVDNQEVIAELSRRLEGIPLALELAAARAAVMSPAQMLSRLSEWTDLLVSCHQDIPERHRTLRAALDWSYNLLTPELKRFFAQLSVFRGGWTLEAVEAICTGHDLVDKPESKSGNVEVLDYLAQLRDNSLIQAEEAHDGLRFRMLEMLREYAWEHVDEAERAALRRRHLLFFLTLAETASPHLKKQDQAVWLDRLEAEQDNLRTALQFCIESTASLSIPHSSLVPNPSEAGLRLVGALQQFWGTRGHLTEGRKWSDAAISHPLARERTKARANALDGAGALARMQSDYASARTLHEEGLSIYREIGDWEGIASSLNNLGSVARQQGDYRAARAFYEESLAIHREMKNSGRIAGLLNNLGNVANSQGDYMAARALYEEALVINREIGDRAGVALNLNGLAIVAHSQGDYMTARALYEEGLAIRRELGDARSLVLPLDNLAVLAREQGDYILARAYLVECLALCRQLRIRYVAALCLDNFAALVHAQGWAERAACLHGAAAALRDHIGAALSPRNRKEVERDLDTLRTTLGDARLRRRFRLGPRSGLGRSHHLRIGRWA